MEPAPSTCLVYGSTGWIGSQLMGMLKDRGFTVVAGRCRLEDFKGVTEEVDAVKPDFVLNAAGLTGRPNVDWCEDHKEEVIRVNVLGTLNLLDVCNSRGIHVTNYATGCIYAYNEEHPLGGTPVTEEDTPNFKGSFYSLTKTMVEELSKVYDHVLTLRLRMPLSDDLHPRNFITKITRYEKVVNIPNSMTILSDLLPVSLDMMARKQTGVFNFVNPGAISHNEILDLFKKYIMPTFTYTNFSLEEQSKVLKAGRSNTCLDATKLLKANPDAKIPHVSEGIHDLFKRMRKNLNLDDGEYLTDLKPYHDQIIASIPKE